MIKVLGCFAILLLAVPSVARGAATSTIAGTVENFTGAHAPVPRQDVKLTAYVNDAEADWKTTTTDARGRFSFTVPTDPTRRYVVNVKYKGGDYDSAPIAFKAGVTQAQVPVQVYEPTTDASVVHVAVHHLIVDVGQGMVQVAELLVFTNPTDQTYIGTVARPDGKRETLHFTIPNQARQVQYMEGLWEGFAFTTPAGLLDTADVKPGTRQVAYSYFIPVAGPQTVVSRVLDYPTDRVEVFGSAAATITATPLQAMPTVETDQGTYRRFSAASLGAQTAVTITLSGLPGAQTSTRRIAIAAFAGLMAAVLAFPLLRRRGRAGGVMSRDELLAAAAALDDQYEAGQIAETEYRRRRARYVAQLQRSSGGPGAAAKEA